MRFDNVCVRAAKLLEQDGWCQHRATERNKRCIISAIAVTIGLHNYYSIEEVIVRLARARGFDNTDAAKCEKHLMRWNDSLPPTHGKATIVSFLFKEADRYRRELGEL